MLFQGISIYLWFFNEMAMVIFSGISYNIYFLSYIFITSRKGLNLCFSVGNVLHLLNYTLNLYLCRCSTYLRYILGHSVYIFFSESEQVNITFLWVSGREKVKITFHWSLGLIHPMRIDFMDSRCY